MLAMTLIFTYILGVVNWQETKSSAAPQVVTVTIEQYVCNSLASQAHISLIEGWKIELFSVLFLLLLLLRQCLLPYKVNRPR